MAAMAALHLSATHLHKHPCAPVKAVSGGGGGVVVKASLGVRDRASWVQLWRAREGATSTRASSEAVAATTTTTTTTGGVTEVDKDSFWAFVESAGDKVVVLDMYTQWCGPCKLMLPKVIALSHTYDDVAFAKLDCNQDNKALAKELGVKTVPTFKVFKNAHVVAEVRGAKYDDLVKAIESARS